MIKELNIEIGDLVETRKNSGWGKMVGIVTANDKAWYLLENHFSIHNCIVDIKDINKIIKKQLIPKKYQKYLERK
jgi:hypothetical protein